MAGWLGDEAAKLVVPAWSPRHWPDSSSTPPPWSSDPRRQPSVPDWPARFALEHGPIDEVSRVKAAVYIAAGVMPLYTREFPGDNRIQILLEAVLAWTNDPTIRLDYIREMRLQVRRLSQTRVGAPMQPHHAAAGAAANAAETINYPIFSAYTAETAERSWDVPEYSAKEREIQGHTLIKVLCGDELQLVTWGAGLGP